MTKREKWPFGRTFHQNGPFICIPVLPVKDNYTKKCCGIWHRNGSLNCSWIQMEIGVTQPRLCIKVLTVKEVCLQLDKHQHIYKTAYAGTSTGISSFGPVSPLLLAVLSHPTVSQTSEFMSLEVSVWNICHCTTWHAWNSKKSHHFLGCELCAFLWILLWLHWHS